MVAIIVPGNYGYTISTPISISNLYTNASSVVIAVALGAIPVLSFVHGMITGKQRKGAKVPYPHSYATIEQCKENVRILFNSLDIDLDLDLSLPSRSISFPTCPLIPSISRPQTPMDPR
jgi:hypothetical protein